MSPQKHAVRRAEVESASNEASQPIDVFVCDDAIRPVKHTAALGKSPREVDVLPEVMRRVKPADGHECVSADQDVATR